MTDEKVKLGVLWKNVSRNGQKPYLSGRVQQDTLEEAVQLLREGGRLLVFSAKKRPDKRDPDCILFVVPERPGAAAVADDPAPGVPAPAHTAPAARSARR
jgi:hypothetical protein